MVAAALFVAPGRASAGPIVTDPTTGHSYEYVETASGGGWNRAAANAAAQASSYNGVAGHLATITSAAENTFVFTSGLAAINAEPGHGVATNLLYFWLGGYQLPGAATPSDGWAWVTGEPWDYTAWQTGEPNDGTSTPTGVEVGNENALVYWTAGDRWNDLGEGVITGLGSSSTTPRPSRRSLSQGRWP